MEQANWYEIIGLIASFLVATSLVMSSLVKLRWYNLIGAIVFATYGILIGALSVAVVNIFIVFVDCYHLYKLYNKQEDFRIAYVHDPEDDYLQDFLSFYHQDIRKFFPNFSFKLEEEYLIFFVHRNLNQAGLVIAEIQDTDNLLLHLDYVVPEYRDFKVADFIFRSNITQFKCLGFTNLRSKKQAKAHNKYLKKAGFAETPDGYLLKISALD